jgi:hypothetical protein
MQRFRSYDPGAGHISGTTDIAILARDVALRRNAQRKRPAGVSGGLI